MTSPTQRRPLPALVFLLALSLLAALVWWRVLHRTAPAHAARPSCPTTQPATQLATPSAAQLPRPAAVSVRVLNSTTRSGIALAATTALGKDGFVTASRDNDTDPAKYGSHGTVPGVAEIRYAAASQPAARLLAYYFPGATLVLRKGQDGTVLVALGTRFSRVTAPATVEARLRAAGITTGAPTAATSNPSC
ncbi:MAG: LytR C-terminal domain-containing protein [Jatrophihabitantaceae bacterium]